MNTDHKKYQSLSEVEAHAIYRQVEARISEAFDLGQKAGFDCGVESTINRIVPVEASGSCSVSGCKNYHLEYVHNCSENMISECQDYKGGGQS